MAAASVNETVRYEPDENPPQLVTIGSGIQAAILILAPVVLTVVIVSRIAEQSAEFMTWAIFAALLVSGSTTVLQAVRVGRFGAGHVLMMGTSGAFIAVCAAALKLGGPATMASLIVISALFQFLLAARLSWLRRIFTPIVTGTVIMLIAATVMPIVFDTLADVPEGSPQAAAPVSALVTMVIVVAMVVRAPPAWRLWSPIIAIAVGCLVSIPYGIFDFQQVLDAPWIGIPFDGWPGFDVTPGIEFWALLPAFIVVTLVGAIETIGDGVAIQRVSRRNPRATDFRVVQGALNADGVGNLLSGLLATVPNTTYSSSIALAEVTGVAARRVGVVIGVIFVVLAFFPKVAALLIAIPPPVAAAYITVLVVLLFVQGMRIVINDGMDHRKAIVVGLAFWIGAGFQSGWIFKDLLGEGFIGVLLSNGMTAGAIVAIIVMVFIELTRSRRRRLQVALESDALPKIEQFLLAVAGKRGWNDASTERLTSAGEEMLAILLQETDGGEAETARRLTVNARLENGMAELEFVTSLEGENLEDHLAYLNELPPVPDEREVSFRLLWHYASSVQHQKYHGLDIITVQVEGSR
ncbi:MAG: purine/pyrimidine permease [Chloroflexota bacterium]|nr:purine/pyrimidine permease [Chloroflexota bacterium]MDE2841716.1 purine/pyrimidine permease [Chloroflexota bacterium]MDE2930163.1 purine/pyrimidine permease [Chloroflexota bacterium]